MKQNKFITEAQSILNLQIKHRVNRLGGYGPEGEVIYTAHPSGCPSVLVDSRDNVTATFMSNGSLGFRINLPQGLEVNVLDGHFEPVEKRECGVPSGNVWLALCSAKNRRIVSLINPRNNVNLAAENIKIVKLGDPDRAMWYCADFNAGPGISIQTAVKLSLAHTHKGPCLLREIYVKNAGTKKIAGDLWTNYFLHGTQRFVYNKELWYDAGLPLTDKETIIAAAVPYSEILQIKRVSTKTENVKAVDGTCDYSTFIGDTSAFSAMPQAVINGRLLEGGAHKKLNKFSTAAVSANQFSLNLMPSKSACIRQGLLYVTDENIIRQFRKKSGYRVPSFKDMSASYKRACRYLVEATPGVQQIDGKLKTGKKESGFPCFELDLPAQKTVSEYANSVWTGVKELYENCRAHGAKLADGIELGTRDRGQDMWPKIKEDPGRVRADLVHAFSFMYVTSDSAPDNSKKLTLAHKLYGMFPRQFPSRWKNRSQEVFNDNRPYADSPLWLINSINMYIRETGDITVLFEKVGTIRLTDADHPETSGIIGCDVQMTIIEVILETFSSYQRHVHDTPYGMAQILYGEWCDPVDMFGTSTVGDDKTRGRGRGVHARLSAHLFLTLVETIDLLESTAIEQKLSQAGIRPDLAHIKKFANQLRKNIVNVAWEDGPSGFKAGFVNAIHELKRDGSRPDYKKGRTGYTLGSMKKKDFDGINRRELAVQAYSIEMLATRRHYLDDILGADRIINKILETVDTMFYNPRLGLVMYTSPIANNAESVALVGRMGVVPTGCAENGEYHHCQVFMHRFRLSIPGQADQVWTQFKPMMSAMRDESIAGPFETPCTSYASDPGDPHFGRGMYFGLSGSVDWIIEIFQKIAGLELALHDPALPSIKVSPRLPGDIESNLTFKRIIHCSQPGGGYRKIPLTLHIGKKGAGSKLKRTDIRINGKAAPKAEVNDLKDFKKINIRITLVHGS
jgi:hypothetical protein